MIKMLVSKFKSLCLVMSTDETMIKLLINYLISCFFIFLCGWGGNCDWQVIFPEVLE